MPPTFPNQFWEAEGRVVKRCPRQSGHEVLPTGTQAAPRSHSLPPGSNIYSPLSPSCELLSSLIVCSLEHCFLSCGSWPNSGSSNQVAGHSQAHKSQWCMALPSSAFSTCIWVTELGCDGSQPAAQSWGLCLSYHREPVVKHLPAHHRSWLSFLPLPSHPHNGTEWNRKKNTKVHL